MDMIDENGKKYLLIRFDSLSEDENMDSEWSLVEDNNEFAYTNWFRYSDYEVYRPYQIKEKFYSRTTKLSETKLKKNGYLKVVGKTYEWAYSWFFKLTNLDAMEQFFEQLDYPEKERKFWMFVKMVGIKEEVYILEDWLRLDLAKKWCNLHKINYRIDVPADYPRELPKITLREIKNKITSINYGFPFEFMN